jgi:hypothetical protein
MFGIIIPPGLGSIINPHVPRRRPHCRRHRRRDRRHRRHRRRPRRCCRRSCQDRRRQYRKSWPVLSSDVLLHGVVPFRSTHASVKHHARGCVPRWRRRWRRRDDGDRPEGKGAGIRKDVLPLGRGDDDDDVRCTRRGRDNNQKVRATKSTMMSTARRVMGYDDDGDNEGGV